MSLQCVVGGQFGSEAKGAVTAAVCLDRAQQGDEVIVVRVGGPNAGHSAADVNGRIWALRQVPAGMVVDPHVLGVIASGSEIDVEVLEHEIQTLREGGIDVANRLIISDAATIVTPEHREQEAELIGAIGSTGKGIGAARADRIMRRAKTAGQIPALGRFTTPASSLEWRLNRQAGNTGSTVVLEGTQGYGLGLHTRYYPQVTSGNCRAVDVCAQAGINPWGALAGMQIHVVIRPYPIRVAGNSGPLAGETSWEELGQPVELTTVTKKPRRVGMYDPALVDEALAANSPFARLAVSMVDKVPDAVDPESGLLSESGISFVRELSSQHRAPISWVGTGPRLIDWFRWA